MNIIDGSREYIKPKNIGILMFNDNPQIFFPMSQIEIIEFKEFESENSFTEKIIKGPIHNQIREVLTYIGNTIIKEKHAKERIKNVVYNHKILEIDSVLDQFPTRYIFNYLLRKIFKKR